MKFYTNIYQRGNRIFVRGYDNGTRVQKTVEYKPYLFVPVKEHNLYRTLDGKNVEKMEFEDIKSAKEFIDQYKTVENYKIYGFTQFLYTYIFDNYRGEIKYDPSVIIVANIDIEIGGMIKDGTIERADIPVTAITLRHNGFSHVFGCKDFRVDDPSKVRYVKCEDEEAMLKAFLAEWNIIDPDVVTGWNIEFFDIPYLVNRITLLMGGDEAKRLSPWRMFEKKTLEIKGKDVEVTIPVGVSVLDYYNLYRKFTYNAQESYTLGHIAFIEIKEKKLDYSMYDNLTDMYEKDYQRYIEYNIHDCALVERIDAKMKLLELVYAMSFDAKVNFADSLTSVRLWDVIIHNYLLERRIVVPQFTPPKGKFKIEGGYVKHPQIGLHHWVVSFDLNSLYPHLIMQYNISPETYIDFFGDEEFYVEDLLQGYLEKHLGTLIKDDVTVAANGAMYSRKKRGFLPSLMDKMYQDRSVFKKQMLSVKQEYEKTKDEELTKEIARLNNMQMAKKIQLNSAYGALANQYFRWFDPKHAEAITKSGQFSIRYIEARINEYLNKLLKTKGHDYVIASDTDSIYVCLDKLVQSVFTKGQDDPIKIVDFIDKACRTRIEPFIDSAYQDLAKNVNAYEHKMFMKRESIANKGIWRGKKMYILNVFDQEGVRFAEPQLKTMGIEVVRSSVPAVCREHMKKSLKIIMDGTEKELWEFIETFKEKFMTLPFDDVAFPRGVKNLEKYADQTSVYAKGCPVHVKGALLYNDMLIRKNLQDRFPMVYDGDKIKFAYLKLPNPSFGTVISVSGQLPSALGLDNYIDRDKQFDKTYLDPIKSITDAIGWNTEHVSTLEEFFVYD